MNIDRYRWTEEEKAQVLDQLLAEAVPRDKEPKLIWLEETYDEALASIPRDGQLEGLSTGYETLDKMTGGIGEGDLVVIYGDTHHGKSQLAQNIAFKVATAGNPVAYIGMEMINRQNTRRFINIADLPQVVRKLPILYPAENYIDHREIGSNIAAAKKMGAKLVVIDQLQDFLTSQDNGAAEISLITLEIKRAAIQNKIPVILISHINRQGTKKGPPTLSELKGSSAIEQRADIALAVWRDLEDPTDRTMHIRQRKNRPRGMEHTAGILTVENGVRLNDPSVSIKSVQAIFPGAEIV